MPEPHVPNLERWRAPRGAGRRLGPTSSHEALETGGRPPDPPDMGVRIVKLEGAAPRIEASVARLTTRTDALDDRLRAVERRSAAMDAKLDPLTNQPVGKPPSRWQMPAVIGPAVVLSTALDAGVQYPRAHGPL